MKFTLFEMDNQQVMAKGLVERLGSDKPNLIYKRPDGFVFEQEMKLANHVEAVQAICDQLVNPEHGVIKDRSEIDAIGHRVLHGGEKITAPTLIDENAKAIIRECFPLGPLHNPANLSGIEACEVGFPGVPNVGVFDNAVFGVDELFADSLNGFNVVGEFHFLFKNETVGAFIDEIGFV